VRLFLKEKDTSNMNYIKIYSNKNKYILMVQWETLEDHTIGFRGSEEYKE
jgi:heme-degrading monooxygenase HmoA